MESVVRIRCYARAHFSGRNVIVAIVLSQTPLSPPFLSKTLFRVFSTLPNVVTFRVVARGEWIR